MREALLDRVLLTILSCVKCKIGIGENLGRIQFYHVYSRGDRGEA
jgi:hypothetical protein